MFIDYFSLQEMKKKNSETINSKLYRPLNKSIIKFNVFSIL